MFSFVNKMDEFDYFQKMITGLKERNFSFLQEIVNFLPEGRRNDLKDILGSRRVIIDEKADVSVPRKIFRVLGVKKN